MSVYIFIVLLFSPLSLAFFGGGCVGLVCVLVFVIFSFGLVLLFLMLILIFPHKFIIIVYGISE